MSTQLKPRINIMSNLSKEEIINEINIKVNDKNNPFTGWAKGNYAQIYTTNNNQHIWTPQLNLQIDDYDEGTEVRGVIGPSASVWTAFAFTFAILGFITFVSLFWGLTRLNLDYSANILWVVPLGFTLILGVYISARIGQQVSKDQVIQLKKFIEKVVFEKETE